MPEFFTHKRKDQSIAVFTNEDDYVTFLKLLTREDIDIDLVIDQFLASMKEHLRELKLTPEETKLFFERFKMAI